LFFSALIYLEREGEREKRGVGGKCYVFLYLALRALSILRYATLRNSDFIRVEVGRENMIEYNIQEKGQGKRGRLIQSIYTKR
jgi:hypothetical protein